ncbi:hypothetical protein A0H81_12874 [Grifola frondosa]|uniref:Uncharacterized protein n=1 Tax=Grifola frondosa TaxID=5627 RepID=A0A1C7LR07_GRIFR|nr:hypothetical protein A0H81_12874 [Grifola frondosa]
MNSHLVLGINGRDIKSHRGLGPVIEIDRHLVSVNTETPSRQHTQNPRQSRRTQGLVSSAAKLSVCLSKCISSVNG